MSNHSGFLPKSPLWVCGIFPWHIVHTCNLVISEIGLSFSFIGKWSLNGTVLALGNEVKKKICRASFGLLFLLSKSSDCQTLVDISITQKLLPLMMVAMTRNRYRKNIKHKGRTPNKSITLHHF